MNHPEQMINYHAWANQTILGRIKELPSSALSQEAAGSFPTIAHTLSHMYAIDKTWYLVLTGMSMPEALQAGMPLSAQVLDSAEAYAELFAELAGQYDEWLRGQTDLERAVLLDNPYAGARETRLSEILLQVANHGTYHRGNVTTMLRQLGHASVMTDYCLFWYQGSTAEELA